MLREWVEKGKEGGKEEALGQFTLEDELELRAGNMEAARTLLDKCKQALGGEAVEFAPGVKPTSRNIIEGIQRAQVIINKEAGAVRELQIGVMDERAQEEERKRRVLRQVQEAMKLDPEQLEALRVEFPGMLAVASDFVPKRLRVVEDEEEVEN